MNNNWLTIEQEGDKVILKKCSKEAEGDIVIPEGVTDIGDFAFHCCNKVTSVRIPNGVNTIGKNAFVYCDLTSLHLPASVTKLDFNRSGYLYYSPFFGNSNINSITVDEANPVYDSRNNCNAIIETSANRLILACNNTKIPDSVAIIGNASFYCSDIQSIVIPKEVILIEDYALYYGSISFVYIPDVDIQIGFNAFWKTTKIKTYL